MEHISIDEIHDFVKNYIKYPPRGKGGWGDPHCSICGKATLLLDDVDDFEPHHGFFCEEHGGEPAGGVDA